jgi:Lipase maturation factor
MFGFGKLKFSEHDSGDWLYLKGFFVSIPMPTPLGLLAHRMPDIMHYFGLVFLFITEIPAPFLLFTSGNWRLSIAILVMLLQIGIQSTGNYSFFNTLSFVVAISVMDVESNAWDTSIAECFAENGDVWGGIGSIVVLCMFPITLMFFLFNSWCSPSWFMWPTLELKHIALHHLVDACRFLFPFRVVHAFGIFPPHSNASLRMSAVFEGSADGKQWREYKYRYFVCDEQSRGRFIAPYQPRFEFEMFYQAASATQEPLGVHPIFSGDAYHYASQMMTDNVMRKLLQGCPVVSSMFANDPFHVLSSPTTATPPKYVRIALYALVPNDEPTSKVISSGRWWTRYFMGLHADPQTLPSLKQSSCYDNACSPPAVVVVPSHLAKFQSMPCPELWHVEQSVWRERCPRLQQTMKSVDDAVSRASTLELQQLYNSLSSSNTNDAQIHTPFDALVDQAASIDLPQFSSAANCDDTKLPDISAFWTEFVDDFAAKRTSTLRSQSLEDVLKLDLDANVTKARQMLFEVHLDARVHWGDNDLQQLELFAGRLTQIMVHRFDHLYRSYEAPWEPPACKYLSLGQASQFLVMQGRPTYIRAIVATELVRRMHSGGCGSDVAGAAQEWLHDLVVLMEERMDLAYFSTALFRFRNLLFQVRKLRIMDCYGLVQTNPVISSCMNVIPQLTAMFPEPTGHEFLPHFSRRGVHWDIDSSHMPTLAGYNPGMQ